MTKISTIAILALALVLTLALAAQAAPVSTGSIAVVGSPSQSLSHQGNFSLTLQYSIDDTDSDRGYLQVSQLTNTGHYPGLLIRILFNNPNNAITAISMGNDANDPPLIWVGLDLSNDSYDSNLFGKFDFGAEAAGLDIPSLANGIPSGVNKPYISFNLNGTDLDKLTTGSFVQALSNVSGGGTPEFCVAFFTGYEPPNNPYDIVPATPLPGTLLFLGSGLLGLVGWRWIS